MKIQTKSKLPREDITGRKFGDWVVLEFSHYKKYGTHNHQYWQCQCICRNKKNVAKFNLTSKKSTKCNSCKAKKNAFKHGDQINKKPIKIYMIWGSMKSRCNNENINNEKNKHKKSYFTKKICVCDEWKDYIIFKKWALENGYKEGLQIHRKDNNGNYCPENCVWVTPEEHAKISAEERKQAKKEREYAEAA